MRAKLDQYPTPVFNGTQILQAMHEDGLGLDEKHSLVLDPASGRGNLLMAAKNVYPNVLVRGMEIDDVLAEDARIAGLDVTCQDALKSKGWDQPPWKTVVFMNPPYSHAMEFVEAAVCGGFPTIALLRLSFLGSQSRAKFHNAYPSRVYVVKKRIKFVGNATDNTDSAWFVWNMGKQGTWRIL